jgi:hypothetical protein
LLKCNWIKEDFHQLLKFFVCFCHLTENVNTLESWSEIMVSDPKSQDLAGDKTLYLELIKSLVEVNQANISLV